ncbi:UPF0223 family protein [Solibacillus sp. FSL W7-1472]|uniref:UPF0223 protein SSIL_3146 n=1 Tax=Solibacillus silvestris (strain StLB046) TaxID=1002809 RepID=F2F750_SOLSS|nr:UPF0223 family protein [Solibacillus silvestris]OBW58672.1 hypothetical protein A9986_06935 [Solibacillus silvestris]BAK17569.1 uncharacterized protein SSIL_3146 [Solibacillus silvestris StLB046]
MEYSYPLSTDWSTDEMVDVVRFFEVVEMAYEKGAKRELVMARYKRFKEIVPSQAEEKTIFREFEQASSYVPYRIVKLAKELSDGQIVRMK